MVFQRGLFVLSVGFFATITPMLHIIDKGRSHASGKLSRLDHAASQEFDANAEHNQLSQGSHEFSIFRVYFVTACSVELLGSDFSRRFAICLAWRITRNIPIG